MFKSWMCNDEAHDQSATTPSASFRQLFMFASLQDKLLMAVGVTCAAIYGLRILIMGVLVSSLMSQISTFDASQTYSEMQLLHNVTGDDEWSRSLMNQFGTTSLSAIFSSIFNGFSLRASIFTIVLWVAYYGLTITLDVTARRQANRALSLYLQSLMRQDMSWFDGNQTGKIVTQTSDDFQKFQDAIGFKLGLLVTSLSGFVLPVFYCAYLNWRLTLLVVCFMPFILLSFIILSRSRTYYSKQESNEYAKAGSIAEEVLSSIKTVVSFGAQTNEAQRFVDHLRNDTKAGFMKAFFASVAMSIFNITFCMSFAASMYFGSYLMENDPLGGRGIFSMSTIIFSLNVSSLRLSEAFGHIDAISHAKSSFGRILNMINQPSTIGKADDLGVTLHQKIETVAFRNVSFNYASRTDLKILDNFNLEVKSGETIAIVGESGSGKSTLISLLLRFYDTTEGSVLLNDTEIRVLSPHWLRKQIGLVGQEPVLFPTTIGENIAYGKAGVTLIQIENAARLANAHDFISDFPMKYETLVGDRGAQLSGGQKQRIAIARALIRNPQILLLDEATSALDSQSEAIVQDALEKASRGRTTFVIAHRLSTVRNANRIVVVSFGKIVESGTHEELMKLGGVYHSFATKQDLANAKDEDCGDAKGVLSEAERVRLLSIISPDMKTLIPLDNDKKSSAVAILNLFRLGYMNSLLLAFGMIGSIIYGGIFVIFVLEGMPTLFLVFSESTSPDVLTKTLTRYLYFATSCAAIFLCSSFLQFGFLGVASSRIGKSIRSRIFSSLLRQEMAFFDDTENSVGSLCLMLSLHVNNVKNAIGVYLAIMLSTLSQMIISAGIMFVFNYQFGIIEVALLLVCLMGAVGYQIMHNKKATEASANLRVSNEVLRQIVTNIRTVVSLGLETEFHNKFITYHRTKTFAKWKEYLLSLLGVFVEGSSQIGVVFLGLGAIPLLLHNQINIMSILRSFGIIMITNSVARSIAVLPNFAAAMNSLQRIFDVIDLKPKHVAAFEPSPLQMQGTTSSSLIQFRDVSFSYPTRSNTIALKGFSLSVKKGQTVALVGGSGSGKSTCIQLLERFYEPDTGIIRVGGNDLSSLDVGSLRREMALVQQEPSLFDRTVAENIAYGDLTRTVTMEEVVDAAIIANAHEFITELPQGYETRVGERGTQISGGQKQRIAIARALVRKTAKIILLDEATSALDTETEKNVQNSLKANRSDMTFIVVAHRLSTIVDADVIVVIDKGRIVETGKHSELMAKQGHYFKLQHLKMAGDP